MIDGFYSIAFTGERGSGFGLVAFRSGIIVGADVTGAIFNGEYTEASTAGKIAMRIDVTIPAGVVPVQTGISLASSVTTTMEADVSVEDIQNQRIILLQSTLGPVNVVYRKIRDFPASA